MKSDETKNWETWNEWYSIQIYKSKQLGCNSHAVGHHCHVTSTFFSTLVAVTLTRPWIQMHPQQATCASRISCTSFSWDTLNTAIARQLLENYHMIWTGAPSTASFFVGISCIPRRDCRISVHDILAEKNVDYAVWTPSPDATSQKILQNNVLCLWKGLATDLQTYNWCFAKNLFLFLQVSFAGNAGCV